MSKQTTDDETDDDESERRTRDAIQCEKTNSTHGRASLHCYYTTMLEKGRKRRSTLAAATSRTMPVRLPQQRLRVQPQRQQLPLFFRPGIVTLYLLLVLVLPWDDRAAVVGAFLVVPYSTTMTTTASSTTTTTPCFQQRGRHLQHMPSRSRNIHLRSSTSGIREASALMQEMRDELAKDEDASLVIQAIRGQNLNDDDSAVAGLTMQLVDFAPEDDGDLPYDYDPGFLKEFFSKRPLSVLTRIAQLATTGGGFLFQIALDRALGRLKKNPDLEVERAAQLRDLITSLGPFYIKVGQALRYDTVYYRPASSRSWFRKAVPPSSRFCLTGNRNRLTPLLIFFIDFPYAASVRTS